MNPREIVRSKTTFNDPLKWSEPRLVFTCSWSDFFIEESDQFRSEAWEIIRTTPRHTYQILTKRPQRILKCLPERWPWTNVWLGVTVENRETVHRLDMLRSIPAALRFVSTEPLLEDLGTLDLSGIAWVIAGCESGPDARPMDLAWVRSLKDQSKSQNALFYLKQTMERGRINTSPLLDNVRWNEIPLHLEGARP